MSQSGSIIDTIDKRLFLVGASRSGTTILQALIASHPEIHSFPETSFFILAIGEASVWRQRFARLGLATGKERWAIHRFLRQIERQDLFPLVSKRPLLLRTAVDGFTHVLDFLTLEEDRSMWVEKSPLHFYYINFIQEYVVG